MPLWLAQNKGLHPPAARAFSVATALPSRHHQGSRVLQAGSNHRWEWANHLLQPLMQAAPCSGPYQLMLELRCALGALMRDGRARLRPSAYNQDAMVSNAGAGA